MPHRWLTLLTFAFLAVIVFGFYFLRLQPIEIPKTDEAETIVPGSQREPSVSYVNPKKGATEPELVLVEFGDFECTPCKTLAAALDIVLSSEPSVQIVWKNMPNESAHELATPAAIAAHCAADQGQFWAYHNELFARQTYLNEEQFLQIAQALSLNIEAFQKCYASRETLPLVRKDFDEGLALDITATPTLFIEGERLVGALSAEEILRVVRQKLAED